MEIVEYIFHGPAIFNIVDRGRIKGIDLYLSKSIRPQQIFTIFFERDEKLPEQDFKISLYDKNDTVTGRYLASLKKRDSAYYHVYYEKHNV